MGKMEPHTDELLDEANTSILFIANRPQVVMEHGEGMYVWDTEGKRYLRFYRRMGGYLFRPLPPGDN